MGHSSKKKKRGTGGRKGRASLKDSQPVTDDGSSLIAEEIVALGAIFQDDFQLLSESPNPQFTITLRPYSNETDGDGVSASAQLLVRCVAGYPYKCPKLRIMPQEGLSDDDADHLLSLLLDQANTNAREGRVMIFNLVEAAQEFLSEVTPIVKPISALPSLGVDMTDQRFEKDMMLVCDTKRFNRGYSVYGLIDLFSDLGIGTDSTNESLGNRPPEHSSSVGKSHRGSLNSLKIGDEDRNLHVAGDAKYEISNDRKSYRPASIAKLDALNEEVEECRQSSSPTASGQSLSEVPMEEIPKGVHKEDLNMGYAGRQEISNDDDLGDPWISLSLMSEIQDQSLQTVEKDLVLIHLLRLVCSSGGPLPGALRSIASELFKLGIVSERARDLAVEPSLSFHEVFNKVFREHMTSTSVSNFWKASADYSADGSSSLPSSRYLNDFEELSSLGHGGFGYVMLCKNKIDERRYAVKKIRVKDKSLLQNVKILREVATLSRFQHQHIVRYYQAWFETEVGSYHGHTTLSSRNEWSSKCSYSEANSEYSFTSESKLESTYLYIQMEYCPRTLRQVFESYTGHIDEKKGLDSDTDLIQWRQTFESSSGQTDKEYPWHLFRQIVEGLAHIHAQKIIHRDLTPSNIFFDAQGDIKIGDFGLAKFLKAEQLDHDSSFPPETAGSVDGTGQVGTYFYTAPEIEQAWPQIDEKVDMYSLGVVLFELWHPFSTAMERHIVLSDLKQKKFPSAWVAKFPQQELLVCRLMSENPSDRPTAEEVIEHLLPPRMEDKWLKDILRMIQTAEKSYVYDRVMSTLFDENRLIKKYNSHHGEKGTTVRDGSSFVQFTEFDTELRDHVVELAKVVCKLHGARRLEVAPMRVLDGNQQLNRKAVKLLTREGNMLELCHDLRMPFVDWVVTNQTLSFKRYEVSWVYRRGFGHSPPNRYLQGDFDIAGGATAVAEAEVIKVAVDIVSRFFHSDACDIRLNHDRILGAVWSWIGVENEMRQSVAKVLSSMFSLRPQSSACKSKWVFIRRQLIKNLKLEEAVVDRIQTANLRFCGSADITLARLRGIFPLDKATRAALDELSTLASYLRIWKIENCVSIDALLPPTEEYYRELFFQIYKDNASGSAYEGQLLAVGGRYDYLVQQSWHHESVGYACQNISVGS